MLGRAFCRSFHIRRFQRRRISFKKYRSWRILIDKKWGRWIIVDKNGCRWNFIASFRWNRESVGRIFKVLRSSPSLVEQNVGQISVRFTRGRKLSEIEFFVVGNEGRRRLGCRFKRNVGIDLKGFVTRGCHLGRFFLCRIQLFFGVVLLNFD